MGASLRLGEKLEHASSEKVVHEPKAIISLQTKNSRNPRRALGDRLALIELKMREVEDAPNPAKALARVSKKFEALRKEHTVTSDVDERSLMGPFERTRYDRERLEELQVAHQEEVRAMQRKLKEEKANIGRMKRKIAAKKSNPSKRRRS